MYQCLKFVGITALVCVTVQGIAATSTVPAVAPATKAQVANSIPVVLPTQAQISPNLTTSLPNTEENKPSQPLFADSSAQTPAMSPLISSKPATSGLGSATDLPAQDQQQMKTNAEQNTIDSLPVAAPSDTSSLVKATRTAAEISPKTGQPVTAGKKTASKFRGKPLRKPISAQIVQPKPTEKPPAIPLMLDHPDPGVSTITGAITTTLATHPQILEQFANELAAKADISREKGALLPSLDISGAIGPENTDNPATRSQASADGGSGDVNLTRRESQILLRQLLFDGGNVTNHIRQASANYDVNAYQLWEAKELLSFNAADAFLNVLRQRELVQINMLDQVAHEILNKKIIDRYRAGAGTKSDVELATSRLALSRSELTQSEGDLANANDTYMRVVGVYPTVILKSPFVPQHLPGSLQQAQQLGMNMSPTVQASLAQIAAAQAATGIARSAFYPTVSIDVTERHDDNLDGILGSTNQRQAVVRASYNVFRGGSDAAAVSAANYRVTAAVSEAQRVRRDVSFDIAQSWNNLLANLDKIRNLTIHQDQSYLVWQAYIKQFQLGQRTLFDMLNAQSEYYNARSSLVNATYDAMSARYQLLASMGALVGTITNPSADVFRRVPLASKIPPGEAHAQMVPAVGANVPPPTTHLPNIS